MMLMMMMMMMMVMTIRWKFVGCPYQSDTYYIVNARHHSFLDTHGRDVWVWNNGGRDVKTVITQN
eukprot:11660174-Karenia_brevis.AAC.1